MKLRFTPIWRLQTKSQQGFDILSVTHTKFDYMRDTFNHDIQIDFIFGRINILWETEKAMTKNL